MMNPAPRRLLAFLAAALALALVLVGALPAGAGHSEGVSYLLAHQAGDGGFYEAGRQAAGQDSVTAWCVMALRAAGVDPGSVRSGGRSPLDFLATQSGNWRSVTDYERTLLAATAAGADPRSFGGVDLVGKVLSFQGPKGNIGDAVNSNAFGILALRSAGMQPPGGAVAWQQSVQNADGGWGNSPGAASNPDMTAASVMALRSAGVPAGDPSIAAALGYLHSIQAPDGGFSFQAGSSDVSATAWCVQAIISVGQDPGGAEWSLGGATPRGYLLSMQEADGHFTWTAGRDMNPVWTTAYAVCALAGKPYPVAVATSSSGGGEGGTPGESEAAAAGAGKTSGQEQTAGGQEEAGAEQVQAAGETGQAEEGGTAVEAAGTRALGERALSEEGGGSAWAWWLVGALAALAVLGCGSWAAWLRLSGAGPTARFKR